MLLNKKLQRAGEVLAFEDYFTESSNTDLPSHTPDLDMTGSRWADAGTWTVNAANDDVNVTVSGATGSLHSRPNRAWIDDGRANGFRIEVDARHTGGGYPATLGGIMLNIGDNINYYHCSFYGYSNQIMISKIVANTSTNLAGTSFTCTWDTWYNLVVEMIGDQCTFTVDGSTQVSATLDDTTLNNYTKHGLGAITWAGESHVWRFDNFKYTRI